MKQKVLDILLFFDYNKYGIYFCIFYEYHPKERWKK